MIFHLKQFFDRENFLSFHVSIALYDEVHNYRWETENKLYCDCMWEKNVVDRKPLLIIYSCWY